MTPIPLTETQMAELFRLRAENATLQTEIAELRIRMNAYQQAWNSDELEKSLSVENAALKEQVAQLESLVSRYSKGMRENLAEALKGQETIAQQAEAIRLKDAALDWCIGEFNLRLDDIDLSQETIRVLSARHIQPSPEILEVRDDKVAEACAKVLDARWDDAAAIEIRSGEWRKYL